MEQISGLLITLFLGLFILVGTLIVFITKNNDKFIQFSLSLAFGVMVTLIVLDLIPEAIELVGDKFDNTKSFLIIFISTLLGIFILKLLDKFVPDHDDDGEIDNDNLLHIGVVSSIALVLHNIIEGMAVYTTVTSSLKLGLMVSIGVGLHNIPLGMVIASTFYTSNKSKKKTILISFLISISTFIGGLLMCLISSLINDLLLGILLCITLGMLLYIIIFELFPHIIKTKYKSISIIGVISGIALLIISSLF